MKTNNKILLASGYIDMYVDKKKYNKLSDKVSKFSYVEEILKEYLNSHVGTVLNDTIEIRDINITSNNFWGQDTLHKIPDIGYCNNNLLPKNDEHISLRIFLLDITAVVPSDFNILDSFQVIKKENHIISISSGRLI